MSVGNKVLVIIQTEENHENEEDYEEENSEEEKREKRGRTRERKRKETPKKNKKKTRKMTINLEKQPKIEKAKIIEIKEKGYLVQLKNKKQKYVKDKNVMLIKSKNKNKLYKITTPDKKNFENRHNFQNTPYQSRKSTLSSDTEKLKVLPHYSDSQLRSICDIDFLLKQKDFLLSCLEKKNYQIQNSNSNISINNFTHSSFLLDSDFQQKYALIVCKLNEINLLLKNSFSDLYKRSSYSSLLASPYKSYLEPSPKNVSSDISFRANQIFEKNTSNVFFFLNRIFLFTFFFF